jgi:hypothetical protein
METGECQVSEGRNAAMLPRDNVIYLKRRWVELLVDTAILTGILGASPDFED